MEKGILKKCKSRKVENWKIVKVRKQKIVKVEKQIIIKVENWISRKLFKVEKWNIG